MCGTLDKLLAPAFIRQTLSNVHSAKQTQKQAFSSISSSKSGMRRPWRMSWRRQGTRSTT